MRIGPLWLVAGTGLLVAGITSTRLVVDSDHGFVSGVRTFQRVDFSGITIVDVTSAERFHVRIGESVRLGVDLLRWQSSHRRYQDPIILSEREGQTLRLSDQGLEEWVDDIWMTVPAHIAEVVGKRVRVHAAVPVDALSISATYEATWSGDANRLDVRIDDGGDEHSGCIAGVDGGFHFYRGQVERMLIVAGCGDIKLHDLSRVGDIEIRAGEGVGLYVRDLGDLARLRISRGAGAIDGRDP